MATILDGTNKPVAFTASAIKKAVLGPTSIVSFSEYDELSISFFESPDGDEIDVYDPRKIYDPQTVYEVREIDLAIKEFMALVERELAS